MNETGTRSTTRSTAEMPPPAAPSLPVSVPASPLANRRRLGGMSRAAGRATADAAPPPQARPAHEGPRPLQSSSPLVPLNVFQRLARRWDEVHPYNAAQAMKVRRDVDPAAAEAAWGDALTAAGLGRVAVGGGSFRHVVLNGELARYPLAVVPPDTSLADYLSVDLNRPFDDPNEPPFRPFVAHTPDGTYLGVTYQHWVADSVAIRLLLREWFCRLCDPARARPEPLPHPETGYWNLFGPARPGWQFWDTVWSIFRRHLRCRRARKVQTSGARDYPVRVLLRQAPPGLIDRLLAWSRGRGLKINDVFLAAAAEACDRYVPSQRRRNRRDVAVGSIVDLRPHAGDALRDTFGLFLGFTEVVCRPGELRDFGRLVATVGRQNRWHRRMGASRSSLGTLLVMSLAKHFVPLHEVYHFYRKEAPLLGGVSNVNLNGTWVADYHPDAAAEYLRISPTGPLAPVVFTLTTLGDRLHLSMTYRQALLTEDAAAGLADMFLGRLAALGEGAG